MKEAVYEVKIQIINLNNMQKTLKIGSKESLPCCVTVQLCQTPPRGVDFHNSRGKLELLRRNLNNPPLIPAAILNFLNFFASVPCF